MPEITVDETYVSDALSNFLADEVEPRLEDKQDTLVSGTNIKTINGTSILCSGDLTIEGGSGSGTTVEANPTLSGSEADLTSIAIDGTSYKIPTGGSSEGSSGQEIIMADMSWITEVDGTIMTGTIPEEYQDIERLKQAIIVVPTDEGMAQAFRYELHEGSRYFFVFAAPTNHS
jgi:hypothetical protein